MVTVNQCGDSQCKDVLPSLFARRATLNGGRKHLFSTETDEAGTESPVTQFFGWSGCVGNCRIWYADFARGFLGRLDVATGKVTEWQSPSGAKAGPLRHVLP